MLFMDVVCAVIAKLHEDENPFICEEEIEDIYCFRLQALTLVKRWHWAWTIGEEVRRRRTNQEATRAAAALEKEKKRTIAEDGERRRSAATAAILREIKNPPSLKTIVNPGDPRFAAEIESEEELLTAARNEERLLAAARTEFLHAIQNPPALKNILKPRRKKNHLVVIEIHLLRKLKATKTTKQQKQNRFLLETKKNNHKAIGNTLERADREGVKYAAASPRVSAIEDWYDFQEEEDEFYDTLDTYVPDADKINKDGPTRTKDEDDWLKEEIRRGAEAG